MLTEQKNNTVRNPFIMIGKVFKYEFIATARRLALIYALIPIISLTIGILIRNTIVKAIMSEHKNEEAIVERFMPLGMILYFLCYIFIIVASISTIIVLYNRFKKGMFGKEAYLNFTLPVSAGEHLCARILSAVAWDLIFDFTMFISMILLILTNIDKILKIMSDHNAHFPSWETINHGVFERNMNCSCTEFLAASFVTMLVASILFVVFLYMISCIGHLAKKHKILLQFIAVIASFTVMNIIVTNLFTSFIFQSAKAEEFPNFVNMIWMMTPIGLAFSAIYIAICYLVLKFRLNLE